MFCSRCGTANGDGARFCINCGEQINEKVLTTPVINSEIVGPEPERNLAGMILGIVSTVCAGLALWFMLLCLIDNEASLAITMGIVFGIPGLICALIGRGKGSEPHRMTKIGLILSICALGTTALAFTIAVIDAMSGRYYYF